MFYRFLWVFEDFLWFLLSLINLFGFFFTLFRFFLEIDFLRLMRVLIFKNFDFPWIFTNFNYGYLRLAMFTVEVYILSIADHFNVDVCVLRFTSCIYLTKHHSLDMFNRRIDLVFKDRSWKHKVLINDPFLCLFVGEVH